MNKSTSSGISVVSVLGVVFVVLKLCGVINWSWWWVLAPFWGQAAVVVVILLVVGIYSLVLAVKAKK